MQLIRYYYYNSRKEIFQTIKKESEILPLWLLALPSTCYPLFCLSIDCLEIPIISYFDVETILTSLVESIKIPLIHLNARKTNYGLLVLLCELELLITDIEHEIVTFLCSMYLQGSAHIEELVKLCYSKRI